jgi:hypothetical protein
MDFVGSHVEKNLIRGSFQLKLLCSFVKAIPHSGIIENSGSRQIEHYHTNFAHNYLLYYFLKNPKPIGIDNIIVTMTLEEGTH